MNRIERTNYMKRIICFDTSIATSNMGDYIISESCDRELQKILEGNFVLRFPTHTPVSHFYQDFKKFSGGRYRDGADLKFVYGTNLLNCNMFTPTPTWNINLFNIRMLKNIICVGVGMGSDSIKPNMYTRILFKSFLNPEIIHSTRDEKTADFLRSLGFRALNTGCATTWCLTNEHCCKIPFNKSSNVMFTLTDYKRNREADRMMIKILRENYERLFFWIQGIDDYEYLCELGEEKEIQIVGPSLQEYAEALKDNNIEYVGTRLHAGIKAMQMKKRAIIIEVDNRAVDMKKNVNLNTISRKNISHLDKMINSELHTQLGIKSENIQKWKEQFNAVK